MTGIPSVGDILLLSSLAWKIGTAFTSGRSGAPAEFQEVENELESLTQSITMLADTLETDDSILERADDKTKEGLAKILDSCQETLENLQSFVNNYQEIKKPADGNGPTQRTWKSSLKKNWKMVFWTSEGGNIQALRNMLQMHISSISLTMKALQSKSLARLESTIEPMAEKVDNLHDGIIGNLDVKIAEMHALIKAMASPNGSPWIGPSSRQGTDISLTETLISDAHQNTDLYKNVRPPAKAEEESNSVVVTKAVDTDFFPKPLSPRPDKSRTTSVPQGASAGFEGLGISNIPEPGSDLQTPELNGSEFSPGSTPDVSHKEKRWSDLIPANPYGLPSSPSTIDDTKASNSRNRWSAVSDELPTVHDPHALESPQLLATRRPSSQYGHPSSMSPIGLGSPVTIDSRNGPPSSRESNLHPPAIRSSNTRRVPMDHSRTSSNSQNSLLSEYSIVPHNDSRRPSSPLMPADLSPKNLSPYTPEANTFAPFGPRMPSDSIVIRSNATSPALSFEVPGSRPPLHPRSTDESGLLSPDETFEEREASRKNPCSPSQHEQFRRAIFGDAAILCEARAASVEYTVPDEEKNGDFRMEEATGSCTISVVTKRFKIPNTNKTRYITSIWALSDDRTVRLQQRLLDDEECIPYQVWGNLTKVVLRIPTELKFHGFTTFDKPVSIAKTHWINYLLEDEEGAKEFQNALMGKRLLYSLSTRRTLRTHDNIVANTFTFQEQLCGLENLRLWSDDEGDGSVLAMIQYSSNFREGYLAFRLGGPYTSVLVKDDGEKWVKIKGLNVNFESAVDGKAMRRRKSSGAVTPVISTKEKKEKSDKRITGVKIEFVTMADKHHFLEQFKTAKSGKFLSKGSP